MYLQECTNTGGMFCECFLIHFSSCLGYIWASMVIFVFSFNCYFCYDREKIPDNQAWAGTCSEKDLDFFHISSEDFLSECALVLKFIFKVWWGSFHFDHLHVSDINPGQILETESLKNRWEFPHLESLPAIAIHIFLSNIIGTTLPWPWFLTSREIY